MRDRDLVRLYWPVELRPAFDALFGIDDALADVVMTSSQPALGAIRLAWWREALQRLDSSPPPPEPRLQTAARELLSRGITGAELARIEAGWAVLLEEIPDPIRAAQRGEVLFGMGSRLLGSSDIKLLSAGRLFALADHARRGLVELAAPVDELSELRGHRFSRKLRPLTALARLSARDAKQAPDIEFEATPGRAATLLFHRLLGTIE